ncbi:hypothetical protein MRX96_012254 [Rhipicephalus microplus]
MRTAENQLDASTRRFARSLSQETVRDPPEKQPNSTVSAESPRNETACDESVRASGCTTASQWSVLSSSATAQHRTHAVFPASSGPALSIAPEACRATGTMAPHRHGTTPPTPLLAAHTPNPADFLANGTPN